jgi:DNA-binding CsgD family transcriptional regulator/tRNA A37 threonylcarbamoyladenosine biosynthesis protein TsaE
MQLLERENQLKTLNNLFTSVQSGNGKVAVITGEAGIGKTSLIEEFAKQHEPKIKILWGSCDALKTPRPLSPLYDICFQMNSILTKKLKEENEIYKIFNDFLFELSKDKKALILVIEDIHWADEATLDLIKFLGRRINRHCILLAITYRDDESNMQNSLSLLTADIPPNNISRIKLNPLSEKSVNNLEKYFGFKNDEIYNKTAGNPLFVFELISNKNERLPSSIKDIVLSKLSNLSSETRKFLELISVIPGRINKDIINQLSKHENKVIDEAVDAGILKIFHEYILFKHELVRLAIEDSLTFFKKEQLNSQILSVLLEQKEINQNLASIVHHADNANNIKIISEYAPIAAQQASALGAHNQAANHYLTALKYIDHLSVDKQLQIYEGRSFECYLTGQIEEGIKACEAVIEMLKKNNDPLREGENYRILSRLTWFAGDDKKGEEFLLTAIDILEKLPVSKNLAMAYSNLSQVYMLRENTIKAIEWGEKAIQISKQINEIEIEIHALNNIGTAKMYAGDDSGEDYLKKSLDLAIKNDFHDHISRGYDNLGAAFIYRRSLSEADKYYTKGIEYCSEKDLHTHELCMTGEISKIKLFLGDWDEAIEKANKTLERENVPVIDRIIPLSIIGLIRTRRNDPGDTQLIKEANLLAMGTGEIGKIVTTTAALAESFWLKNKLHEAAEEIENFFHKIKNLDNPWALGEIAFWLWKSGRLNEIPENVAQPFLYQIKGEWKSAAKIWSQLNCPYEQALALYDGDEAAMKKALLIFEKLGASAASQLIKQKMREKGIKNIPKGPRQSTKDNIAGLTSRQIEVLNLLKQGLTNNEIAGKLYISSKTVDHHVSAILSKLNINSRSEAAVFSIKDGAK